MSTIEWIDGPPTVEQVAEHAKRYPLLGCGVWLKSFSGKNAPAPEFVILWAKGDQIQDALAHIGPIGHIGGDRARYLPCTPEGIPVCLLPAP